MSPAGTASLCDTTSDKQQLKMDENRINQCHAIIHIFGPVAGFDLTILTKTVWFCLFCSFADPPSGFSDVKTNTI